MELLPCRSREHIANVAPARTAIQCRARNRITRLFFRQALRILTGYGGRAGKQGGGVVAALRMVKK